VFPARYELNSYIVFRKRLVSKRLMKSRKWVCLPFILWQMRDERWSTSTFLLCLACTASRRLSTSSASVGCSGLHAGPKSHAGSWQTIQSFGHSDKLVKHTIWHNIRTLLTAVFVTNNTCNRSVNYCVQHIRLTIKYETHYHISNIAGERIRLTLTASTSPTV
jgi:hypothetical protein